MPGQGAAKRNSIRQAQKRKAAKKAVRQREKLLASLPKVTEDDLLAFQYTHFGDDSTPDKWFVEAEKALNFEPEFDDGLGYYEDGAKRTLTDEQIAMFRRTELFQMKREQMLQQDDYAEDIEQTRDIEPAQDRAKSPASDASSLEDELLAFATAKPKPKSPELTRKPSHGARSDTAESSQSRKRRKSQDVPYDQRHKRKWESYIEEVDSTEGSLTHRRLVRELDNQQTESIEMDY